MALTVEFLIGLVGADPSSHDEVQDCLEESEALVDEYVGTSVVPDTIYNLAVKRVFVALWTQDHMRTASSESFYETDQAVAPINRDPMTGAYIILKKWILPW